MTGVPHDEYPMTGVPYDWSTLEYPLTGMTGVPYDWSTL